MLFLFRDTLQAPSELFPANLQVSPTTSGFQECSTHPTHKANVQPKKQIFTNQKNKYIHESKMQNKNIINNYTLKPVNKVFFLSNKPFSSIARIRRKLKQISATPPEVNGECPHFQWICLPNRPTWKHNKILNFKNNFYHESQMIKIYYPVKISQNSYWIFLSDLHFIFLTHFLFF